MKILLGLLSIALAAPAMAASGGQVTASGIGTTKVSACNTAKSAVQGEATLDAGRSGKLATVHVTWISGCSCERAIGPGNPPTESWNCSVDARYEN